VATATGDNNTSTDPIVMSAGDKRTGSIITLGRRAYFKTYIATKTTMTRANRSTMIVLLVMVILTPVLVATMTVLTLRCAILIVVDHVWEEERASCACPKGAPTQENA